MSRVRYINMFPRTTFDKILWHSNKLSNIESCMESGKVESFTAGFSQFCSTVVKVWLLGGWLSTLLSVPSISAISLKFLNFLRLLVVRHLAKQLVYSSFGYNNLIPRHLWWIKIVINRIWSSPEIFLPWLYCEHNK